MGNYGLGISDCGRNEEGEVRKAHPTSLPLPLLTTGYWLLFPHFCLLICLFLLSPQSSLLSP